MKVKLKEITYQELQELKPKPHYKPLKVMYPLRVLMKVVASVFLAGNHFKCNKIGMEKLGKDEPCLVLMNHSSFVDLAIVGKVLYPRSFNIVCTQDTFIGKDWLIRLIGCISTKKFVFEPILIKDMLYATKKLNGTVVLFPEAGYTFDGTATTLPESTGKLMKLMKVPVVMIRTHGAFLRDPLYNNIQVRKVDVSADMEYLLSPEEIAEKSVEELNAIVKEQFTFDELRWQQENGIKITEKTRADYLNRVLYKCPHCMAEGKMNGHGIHITCEACGKSYELTELGALQAVDGDSKFTHIPDWYQWERECVRKELEEGTYDLDVDVDICVIVDTKCIYKIGSGHLTHGLEGFHLTGCDGQLDYVQKPNASHSLNSDFNWYELGDIIGLGNEKVLYYCFPKDCKDVVAKTRLAAEELYKMQKKKK